MAVLISVLLAFVGMTLLPWGDVSGETQRGNGIAEHLLAVSVVPGFGIVGVVRAVALLWYVGVVALLGDLALLVFAPQRTPWLRALTCTATVSILMLVVAMRLARTGGVASGQIVALLAAACALFMVWMRPPLGGGAAAGGLGA